jgi:dihydrofolate reductase
MVKVIYSMSISLDGFVETPERSLDWVIVDEELHRYFNDEMRGLGAVIYGRRLYELMVAFWPTIDQDPSVPDYIAEYAQLWREKPKIVFSKTLEKVDWNASLVRGDIPGEIARLKKQYGQGLAVGGAELAASFMKLGLIDEYQLYVQPVILGAGTPMFPVLEKPVRLRLVETRPFRSGVILQRYWRADGQTGA